LLHSVAHPGVCKPRAVGRPVISNLSMKL